METSRGRIAAVAALPILIVGGVLVWRCRPDPAPDAIIHELRAVDANTAIAVRRTDEHAWISAIDAKGKTRWTRKLPDLPLARKSGIVVAGDVVAVRYGHRQGGYVAKDHAAAAFSLKDGRPLWDVVLTEFTPRAISENTQSEPRLDDYHHTRAVDGLFAMWAHDGTKHQLHGVDILTGKIVHTQSAPEHSYAAMSLGTRVIEHFIERTAVLDVSGKTPAFGLTTSYEGCVIGDEYVALEHDGALVAYRNADRAARRVIAEAFQPVGPSRMRRCGRYRDRLVMLLESSDQAIGSRVHVVITDASGKLLHSIDLGHDTLWDTLGAGFKYFPENFSGELSRFLPWVQVTYAKNETARVQRLVMLDLEAGTIAWAGPNDEQIIHMMLFRSGTRWYTFWPTSSWILSVFDGTTGTHVASTQLHQYNGLGELGPLQIAGDRVWIDGRARTPLDKPQFAVLDAGTLATVFSRGVKTTDVTATVRDQLGLK